jgi:hypothetical protein
MKMKKLILFVAVFLTTSLVIAQITEENQAKNGKPYYSLFWGLIKSKNYPKDKIQKSNFEIPHIEIPKFDFGKTDINYERKSILWGAIQWTEKKHEPQSKNSN